VRVTWALTRDNKEVIKRPDRRRLRQKARIFDTDSNYSFDATETEPPNTISLLRSRRLCGFGPRQHRAKSPRRITISSGLGSDISKCLDMTFQ